VTFLEKDGTSEYANSTGAYELDLSLTDDYTRAWREMHVKSDVFCSGMFLTFSVSRRKLTPSQPLWFFRTRLGA
jgi:hypothetical protein